MVKKVNLDFVTKQAERAHARKILEKCREFQYTVCASPPPQGPSNFNDPIKLKKFLEKFRYNNDNRIQDIAINFNKYV